MAHKPLAVLNVRSAPRGSKKGWPTVSAQLSPDVFDRFEKLRLQKRKARGDVVADAIEKYLALEAA